MRTTDTHVYFYNGPFSNFYPCKIVDTNVCREFINSEQAFMFFKAFHFEDEKTADAILKASTPALAKQLGRQVKNYNDDEWNNERYTYMLYILELKFIQNEDLLRTLLQTENKILVEASPVDCIWGVGLNEYDDLILDEKNWRGQNLLGKALMQVRSNLHAK